MDAAKSSSIRSPRRRARPALQRHSRSPSTRKSAASAPTDLVVAGVAKPRNPQRREAGTHLRLGASLGDCAFSISARHKLKNALMMTATTGPVELAGLATTYASTCRARTVSVELARHRWKAVLTG